MLDQNTYRLVWGIGAAIIFGLIIGSSIYFWDDIKVLFEAYFNQRLRQY